MIKLLIETNVEVNLRSIEEFTRVMASELLEDKILFDIQREENLIKKNGEFPLWHCGNESD